MLTVDALLAEWPLLARRGALLPLLPRDVDTVATYDGPGGASAVDAEDRRELVTNRLVVVAGDLDR